MAKLGIIGIGKMGEALLRGILSSGYPPNEILVHDVDKKKTEALAEGLKVKKSSLRDTSKAETVLIAVKPQQVKELLPELKKHLSAKSLVITIAAGLKTNFFEKALGKIPIIRVMPNTPALVKSGVSVLSKGKYASDDDMKTAMNLLSCVGFAIELGENDQDLVTAISGSGPAYFYLFVEHMINSAIELGLEKRVAEALVYGTFFGSAMLLMQTGESPGKLRESITSPGGTTEAALKSLKKGKFDKLVLDAVLAAKKRSEELSIYRAEG